jgi:hypothetical protein
VDQPREADRIQCLECGRWFRALPTHLRRGHGYTDEDYRLKFGVPVGVPLVCLEWSEAVSRKVTKLGLARHLTRDGPPKGYRQRESVRRLGRGRYRDLAAAGTAAAAAVDRTAERRAGLAPYPVTVAQASQRLGVGMATAYKILSDYVYLGHLVRVRRGLYAPKDTP